MAVLAVFCYSFGSAVLFEVLLRAKTDILSTLSHKQ
jgi:hypothetical protein